MTNLNDIAPTLRVERSIAAAPEAVRELITDITRMGDWSPETTSAQWTAGADGPAVAPASRVRTRWTRKR
ncbi:MAG: SRPBCC family protein [Streptosporangiaceae bacterium]